MERGNPVGASRQGGRAEDASRERPGPDEVHVWRVSLAADAAALRRLGGLLSDDERRRAERFRFVEHRRRFAAARGLLRRILSRYVAASPQAVAFRMGPHGKPALVHPARGGAVEFNLSHCEDTALLAVARGRRVGIDIERVRPLTDTMRIARRFFHPAEVRALEALPPGERERAFFTCWTRKEAFLKATGEGVARGLRGFAVWPDPDDPTSGPRGWRVQDIEVGEGYAGALAVEGRRAVEVIFRRLDPKGGCADGGRRKGSLRAPP